MKRREGRSATGAALGIAFLLIAAMLMMWISVGCSSTPTTTPPDSMASTPLKAGDNVTLDQGGGATLVAVAMTTADLDEWTKSAIANDTLGQEQMLSDGRVFAVNRGTSALIIDVGWTGTLQVRIYSGDYYSESGWIPMEYAKRLPAGTVPVQDMPAEVLPFYTILITGTKGAYIMGSFTSVENIGTRRETKTYQSPRGYIPATFYVSGSVILFELTMIHEGADEANWKVTIIKDGTVVNETAPAESYLFGRLPENP